MHVTEAYIINDLVKAFPKVKYSIHGEQTAWQTAVKVFL